MTGTTVKLGFPVAERPKVSRALKMFLPDNPILQYSDWSLIFHKKKSS